MDKQKPEWLSIQEFFNICLAAIFFGISLYLNCLDNGISVGIMTWIFLIITSAFFYNFYRITTLNDGFFNLDFCIFSICTVSINSI